MGDRDDDLEFERSDLRTGRVADSLPAAQRAGAGADGDGHRRVPAATGCTTAEGMPATGAAGRAAWRGATRLLASRRLRGFAVSGFVLLVCAGLLLSLPGMPQALQQALAGPTPSPTATFTPGENQVYFAQTVPWGRLTLDGAPLKPLFGKTSSLPRGRHTLTYVAAPWAPLRCQLSVPAQQGDTCPANGHFGNETLARVVDLGATPERLPEAQRAALTSAVEGAFQAHVETATVLPGDHYLGADGRPAVATIPLRASMTLMLNSDATRAARHDFTPPQCVTLCETDFGSEPDWWEVMVHVIVRWQFAASDGTTIHPGASADLDVGYRVGATWSGSGSGSGTWSVALQPSPNYRGQLCWPAFLRAFPSSFPLTGSVVLNSYPGPNDADGCVLVIIPGGASVPASSGSNATATPLPATAAIFIDRLGMVLAGSDAAHTAAPQLPVASTHERALAQQWMTQQ